MNTQPPSDGHGADGGGADATPSHGAALADIAQRSFARIIDTGIVVFCWMLLTAVIYNEDRQLLTALLAAGFLAAYETIPVARTGQTPGKRIMSIGVVMRNDGRTPPVVNAFLRVAPAIAVTLLTQQFFIVALPFLYSIAGYRADRLGAVDLLAGTAVVKIVED